jgi:transcriptional regulator with XRE-family HTH domain
MRSKKSRSTSVDIAHRAGVSQATVSRVLRGSPLVNPETRARVLEAVRELNYKVDHRASSLRTQRSGTLALLLFEDPTPDESHINPFFLSMLGSITRACARHRHDLLVSFQQLSDDWHADYEDSMKADGLILLGYGDYMAYRSKLEQLVEHGTHFVRWGAVLPDQPGISIGCDNFQGGQLVGEHLLGLGRKRVAFLGHASNHYPEFFDRYRGCDAALQKGGASMHCRPAGRRREFGGSRLCRGAGADGTRTPVRCAVRRQRPHCDRRDARPGRARPPRAVGRRGGRLRRHPDGPRRQPAADFGDPGHLARRRTAGGDAAQAGACRTRRQRDAAAIAGGRRSSTVG